MLVVAAFTFASFSFVFIAWLFYSIHFYRGILVEENTKMVVDEKKYEMNNTMQSVRNQANFYFNILEDQVQREKDVILDALDGRHKSRDIFPLRMPYA